MKYEIQEFIGDYAPESQMLWGQKFNDLEDAIMVARMTYAYSKHKRDEFGHLYHVSVFESGSDGFPENVPFMITRKGETRDLGTIKTWDDELAGTF